MIDNAPLRSLSHKGLTVEGYSRAAVQSYWRVPELKLGFDLGGQPWGFMATPTWFISHTHLDHIAALPVYVARRRMMKMDPPTIYVPEKAIGRIERFLRAVSDLDKGRLPCTLLPAHPGEEIELSREHVVTVSSTCHTLPSVGYVVWDRRRKLKNEYQDLSGNQIRDLRLSGVDVTDEVRTPLVGYLGDSNPDGLDRCPAMYEAMILITEMTFVAKSHRRENIHKYGHMHLDDFLARRERFQNEVIIAAHYSTRYTDERIKQILSKRLPDQLDGRLQVWL
ncbi:MAG: metal-dependent hydrolase [Pirellulales bacterium]|jgi:ribonuclease Z